MSSGRDLHCVGCALAKGKPAADVRILEDDHGGALVQIEGSTIIAIENATCHGCWQRAICAAYCAGAASERSKRIKGRIA